MSAYFRDECADSTGEWRRTVSVPAHKHADMYLCKHGGDALRTGVHGISAPRKPGKCLALAFPSASILQRDMSAPEQHHLTRSPFVGYSRFAVAGVGVLGRAIAERLSALPGTSVVALTRRDEVSLAEGAEAVQVDYSDEELLVRVLGEAKVSPRPSSA